MTVVRDEAIPSPGIMEMPVCPSFGIRPLQAFSREYAQIPFSRRDEAAHPATRVGSPPNRLAPGQPGMSVR
jgi:hypothetical protein